MIIAKHFEFEAAHKLEGEIYGSCSNLHGHTYKLTIEIEGSVNKDGWVVNFKDLSNIIKSKVINILDHNNLNNILDIPTAENIVIWIEKQIKDDIENLKCNIILKSIILYETSNSYAKIIY